MNGHQAPGWYGKLACLGDFAQRRLPREWIEHCDAWLSTALRSSRDALGDAWLDLYLTAPVLRFAWAPGLIDRQWWFGVLMPSCDNVGRYYPLLVAQPRGKPPEDRVALDHLELWFEQVGDAAMATLADTGASVDDLEAALARVAPWPTASVARGFSRVDETEIAPWAAAAPNTGLAGHSIWWQGDTPRDPATMRIVHGLPGGTQFLHLLRTWDEPSAGRY